MRLFLLGSLLFLAAGCNRGPAPRGPSGMVYEGKHVSEWGDQMKSPDVDSRVQAAKVLLKMGKEGHSTKDGIPGLEVGLTDENAAVRGWAIVALAYAARGTPYPITQKNEPVAAMKEAVESPDEELRAEANELAKRMGGPPRGNGKGQGGRKRGPPTADELEKGQKDKGADDGGKKPSDAPGAKP